MARTTTRNAGALRVARALLFSFAVLGVLVAGAGVSQAQTNPDDPRCQNQGYNVVVTVTVDDTVPVAGQTVTITGTGFLPNEVVTIYANGLAVGTVETSDTGSFTSSYTVPADQAVGTQIVIQAVGVCDAASLTLVIGQAGGGAGGGPGGTTGGGLPRTGSDVGWLIRLGVLLVAAGGAVVLYTRKRRGSTVTA
jgi:LPXTG-motif cell wall-anchored protein